MQYRNGEVRAERSIAGPFGGCTYLCSSTAGVRGVNISLVELSALIGHGLFTLSVNRQNMCSPDIVLAMSHPVLFCQTP